MRDGDGRLAGQLSVLSGLCLLAVTAIAFVSLATWSVNDPSYSYANGGNPTNMMGLPGAIFADISMQFLGLGASVMLVAPAIWGWTGLLQRRLHFWKIRLALWPLSIVAASAAFSTIPVLESWPLPVGLGGVAGDLVTGFPKFLFGVQPGWIVNLLIGTVSTALAIGLIMVSSGLAWNPGLAKTQAERNVADDDLDDLLESEDQPSWLLGALGHMYFSVKSRFAVFRERHRSLEESGTPKGFFDRMRQLHDNMTTPPDDGLEVFDHIDARVEPETGPPYGEIVHDEHAYDEIIAAEWAAKEKPREDEYAFESEQLTRVQSMAPPPKPSARIRREAQPSLISSSEFELPSLHFLSDVPQQQSDQNLSRDALEQNARLLEGVLDDFGVKGEIINVRPGPVVTLYELEPAPGIKSSRVIGLADDIARSMSAIAARVAVVPGRNAIGIELPNHKRETVYLREILASQAYEKAKAKLPIILGKTIGGEATIADLAKMPHLLVAGTTGSGKSVAINTMILSILYRLNPDQVKMIMIDPKMLELSIYDGIPHLLTPVVTDPKKAVVALKWTVREMEERYKKMSKLGVRNIDGYNSRIAEARRKRETLTRTIQTGYDRDTGEAIYETEELELEPMPFIVVVIDEMADLMMVAGKDIEGTIQRLAQMARAAGIHVIMATQRPSVDVITGTIKANFPTRISFQVTSKIDSRTILGEQGAEQLLGMGDMLYMAGGGRIQRVHGPFVDDGEVDNVVNHLKSQGVPQYLDSVTEESEEDTAGGGDSGGLAESNDIYDRAVAIVLKDRKVSTSYVQRRLSIGYNRAASLIERMEQEGLISPANHAGKREILVPGEDETL